MKYDKFVAIVISCFAMMLSSCGVSDKDIEDMELNLRYSISDVYNKSNDSITALPEELKLSSLKHKDFAGQGEYYGTFHFYFTNLINDDKVQIWGTAVFDENKHLWSKDSKKGIYIWKMKVNGKMIDRKSSIYNLSAFY